MRTFERWAQVPPGEHRASRRVHLHFYRAPAAILGSGRVEALRTERTVPDGYGHVTGSGEFQDLSVGAVYRAVGYAGSPLEGVPFDRERHVVPHDRGAVLDDGVPVPGLFVTGWIKRGPVGLIGATRSDARETVETLLSATRPAAPRPGREAIDELLRERGIPVVDWGGWLRIDAAERELGARHGRARTKIVDRAELTERGRPNVAVAGGGEG
ncbi:hypothetical protein [Myceligenerans indicum]|uniref:hypothetical protein n=1 Tax=Myceligenerans indicum TaxID=2593663 RepID=UPI0027DCFB0D|nr:hypothetical protein [Myceligenerans indicum]